MPTQYVKVIDAPNVPPRLKGRAVVVTVDEGKHEMTVSVDMPDDPTPNEIGYVRWSVGEFVDGLRRKLPGMIGDARDERIPPAAGG